MSGLVNLGQPSLPRMGPLKPPAPAASIQEEDDDDDDPLFGWFSQAQMDNIDVDDLQCPLFMTDEELKDPKNAEHLAFVMDLQYGDMTNLEIAQELKDKGNKVLQGGQQKEGGAKMQPNPKLAIEIYEDGICNAALATEEGAAALHAVLWSNHAAANMQLCNWGHAMWSCRKAISVEKASAKPYWRGAKCALKIQKFEAAKKFCDAGLSLHPDNKDMAAFLQKAEAELAVLAAEAEKKRQAAETKAKIEQMMSDVIVSRGVKMGKKALWTDQTHHLSGDQTTFLDDDGLLHWPVAFMYPECGQSDFVQDVCEADTLQEHLEMMFPDGADPIGWDHEAKYQVSKFSVYYERVVAGEKYPVPKYREVDMSVALSEVLQMESHVVPGYPILYVLVKGSPYEGQWLQYDQDRTG